MLSGHTLRWLKLIPLGCVIILVETNCSKIRNVSGTKESAQQNRNRKQKYRPDEIPDQVVIWFEDFNQTATGDFPKSWKGNAPAEIVKENPSSGKSLLLTKNGVYTPLTVTRLPEYFTLSFKLTASAYFNYHSSPFQIMFASLDSLNEFTALSSGQSHKKNVVKIWFHPDNSSVNQGCSGYELIEKGIKKIDHEVTTTEFFTQPESSTVNVSIWRQKQKLKVFINKEKIWDLPQGFDEDVSYNSLIFCIDHSADHSGKYFISNLKLTARSPDTFIQVGTIRN